MSEVVVAQRMWQRRDSAANWTAQNPVLAAGEIGVELGAASADPQKFKIGNGVTAWSTLTYFGTGGGGGTVWYTGSGAPSGGLGVDGDYYLRQSDGDVYLKAAGAWTVVMNLKGPTGATGTTGATGPTGAAGPPGPSSSCFPTATFDGGFGDIAVGHFCDLYLPFGFDISEYTLLGDAIGSIQIDVRVADYAAYPPGPGASICGGSPPALSSAIKARNTTLTGWTVNIASGSTIRFTVTSCTGIKKANLVLKGART